MSEKITFRELVELIAKQSEQSQSSTNSFIGELVKIIESGLRDSGSVSISGFGKFELRWMKERPGVNPQTGEEITIPGQNKVVFKPFKALREDVNRPYAKMEARVLDEKPGDSENDANKGSKHDLTETNPPLSKSGVSDSREDDGEDFLVERPNPVKKEPAKPEEKKKEKPVTAPASKKSEVEKISGEHPANEKRPALTPEKETELVEEVQKRSGMNWSYAAAAVLVALVIFLIFLMSRQTDNGSENELASQSDQLTEQVAPNQSGQEFAESEPDVEPGPEPPPQEPDSPPAGEESDIPTNVHTIEQGESLWSIAESTLGNPYLWPAIYNLNQNEFENPNMIQASAELDVPVFSDPDNLTEQQRYQVAEGYLAVYQWTRTNNPDDAKHFLWAVGVFSPDLLDQAASSVDQADLAFAKTR
ncbi:HU family DNA-binding protein [Rhodohalobacter halophilus]|uniref:HU family DNA-binding protein n=1 Tax=Rhodohalobacter halophilus TaxID=1812810 RepID=UPI00083FCEC5|nr:HU family DNA-binding protein [Rhodohalobacter halophilus]